MSIEYIWDLEQGSIEWHVLRADKDTASESGSVMEVNPFIPRNQRELAALKRGELVIEETYPMTRGKKFEGAARDWLNQRMNIELKPCTVVNGDFLASLDGLTEDHTAIAEIKIPMNWEAAVEKAGPGDPEFLPKHYYWQMVQQAHCAEDAETVVFCYYDPDEDRGWFTVLDARELRADWPNLQQKWEEFNSTDHGPLEVDISTVKGAKMAAKRWAAAKRKLKEAQDKEKELKKALLKYADQQLPSVGFGLRITPVTSKGNVDWDKVKASIDLSDEWLESYRKAGSTSMRITGEFEQ